MEKTKSSKSTQHVILRYTETMAPSPGTIELHNAIVKKKGQVWMGKMGKAIGDPMINILKNQIKKGKPAYLFLTKYIEGSYSVHVGVLKDISRTIEDTSLAPSYYSDKYKFVRTWFNISKFFEVDSKIFQVLNGKSSKLPIIRSLKKSMSAILYVSLEENQNIKDFVTKKNKKS